MERLEFELTNFEDVVQPLRHGDSKKKQTCQFGEFVVPADYWVKRKKSEKKSEP